ncbi:MAG: helix-turn-helix transcriptional regulator [Spirochaetes bacterium]|nr:helix-turn-helix transcriptional regulator [Spirochaetota bacterium]
MKKSGRNTKKQTRVSTNNKTLQKKLTHIGAMMQKARIKRGLSIPQLSEKCGVAVPQIYKIESGSNFTLKTLLKVNGALRIKITL